MSSSFGFRHSFVIRHSCFVNPSTSAMHAHTSKSRVATSSSIGSFPLDKLGALSLSKRQIRLKRARSEPIVANF
jgi:hypothetical protein